jgi:hypothetical protein
VPDEPASATLLRRALDGRAWAHRSRTFDALGFRFAIRSDVVEPGRYLDGVLGSLAAPAGGDHGAPAHWYSIVDRGARRTRRRYRVYRDAHRVGSPQDPRWVFDLLLWDLNQQAIATAVGVPLTQ